jgi:hypothetical protein
MKLRSVLAVVAGASLALAGAFASGPACSSNDDADGGDSGLDGTYVDAPTFCDFFTEAGAPCPAVSKTQCFAMCTTGGCYCSATSSGPRWVCTEDFSCVPEAGPLEDSGSADAGEDGGSAIDGGGMDASDAGSAVDASDAADAADASDATIADAGDSGD